MAAVAVAVDAGTREVANDIIDGFAITDGVEEEDDFAAAAGDAAVKTVVPETSRETLRGDMSSEPERGRSTSGDDVRGR